MLLPPSSAEPTFKVQLATRRSASVARSATSRISAASPTQTTVVADVSWKGAPSLHRASTGSGTIGIPFPCPAAPAAQAIISGNPPDNTASINLTTSFPAGISPEHLRQFEDTNA